VKGIIDFTNAKLGYRDYGGSDSKLSIVYQGENYMLKFPEEKTKNMDIQTSEANNVFSEYIGSHIMQMVGLPAHETMIGIYKGEPVVACKDFVPKGYRLQEFEWFSKNIFRKNELGRIPTYNQLYQTFNQNPRLNPIKEKGIQRYWDTFVVDALIGNFDRHRGNWGYLVNEDTGNIQLAPVYDCGSSLYPNLSEKSFQTILNNPDEILKRIYVFPKAALNRTDNIEKVEKFGYFDLLSSDFDKNCCSSLKRIAPKIHLQEINKMINDTPLLSDKKKDFYKKMLQYRKELIIDKSLELQIHRNCNKTEKMGLDDLLNELKKSNEKLNRSNENPQKSFDR
jgi:hypothetical protein